MKAAARAQIQDPAAGASADIRARLALAREAQPAWAALDIRARARPIARAARLMAAEAPAVVSAVAAASRRPRDEVWSAELVPTLDALAWLCRRGPAALAPRRLPRSLLQWYFLATAHRQHWDPVGLVGVVSPRNGLLFLSVPQVAAGLLAGNAVAWKPAPEGGAVALYVASALYRAGLPPRLLPVVTGGAAAAHALVEAGLDKLCFTGSSAAGLELYRLQAGRGRPAVLELSGRHVAIVLADGDLEGAARALVWAKLENQGRNCISVQLVLVERPVYEAFLGRAAAALAAASGASALDPGGRCAALVADAAARGARIVTARPGGPALVADVAPGMRVVDEEIAGPILAVAPVASGLEAVGLVNGGTHRLSASVWSRNRAAARDLARRLAVGQVWINEQLHPAAQPEAAMAGRGRSGFGASRGVPGLMEMVESKVVSGTPRWAPRPYYAAPGAADPGLFEATVRLRFAEGPRARLGATRALLSALVRAGRRAR